MERSRGNTFRKTIHHLKSKQIDEKLQLLSEIPTNNTSNVIVIEPERPTIFGTNVSAPLDLAQDGLDNGRDTTGLFSEDGSINTVEPPGDTSYVLGPMISMWYSWGNFTMIGYVRQSDRRMVNLGRITGTIQSWDGSSNFTSYGQFTLEQAQWYKDLVDAGNVENYRAFYPGPPSNPADAYGRYLGLIVNLAKQIDSEIAGFIRRIMGGFDPNLPPGICKYNNLDRLKDFFGDSAWAFERAGQFVSSLQHAGAAFAAFLLQQQGIVNYTKDNPYKATLPPEDAVAISDALNDVMQTIPRERWENLNGNDLQKINDVLNPSNGPTPSNPNRPKNEFKNTDEYHNIVNNIGRRDAFKGQIKVDKNGNSYVAGINDNYVFTNDADASIAGAPGLINFFATSFGAQNRPDMQSSQDVYQRTGQMDTSDRDPTKWNTGEEIKVKNMPINVPLPEPGSKPSFNPGTNFAGGPIPKPSVKESKEVLLESRQRILRDLKKPVVLPEAKKEKIKHRPKVIGTSPRTINNDLMKKAEVPTSFVKPDDRLWGKYEKNKNARMSQERKNEVLDHLGGSDHAWEWLTETNKIRNKNIMYGNFDVKKNMSIDCEKVKFKILRKEELDGDYLLFLVDEFGKKETILQSELNDRIANEFDKELFGQYFSEQETIDAPNEPLFAKVKNRLRSVVDYEDKPSKLGYPDQPPPEMVNGYHPQYGKDKGYYNKLDPQSAESMPSTGNAEIDAKVQKAKRLKKILGKGA